MKNLDYSERRLVCVGATFLGNPSIIILDEPTSGVDNKTKAIIWNLIRNFSKIATVIFATLDLEEIESLCSRFCIISGAQIKCIEDPHELKSKYKKGFKVEFLINIEKQDKAKAFIHDLLPNAKLLASSACYMAFQVYSYKQKSISKLLEKIDYQRDTDDCGILHWGVSQPNLSDIFKIIAKDAPLNKGNATDIW